MHVGTNYSVDTEASVNIHKLPQLKCFVKEKLPYCKIVLFRPIRRADNRIATRVVDEVITLLKELQIVMNGNEIITRKDRGKKGLYLNQHGFKKFSTNLIAVIRELCKKSSFSFLNLQEPRKI